MKGVCFFHSETGTEGGFWAFQDEKFMEPPSPKNPAGKWSYDGMYILQNGDQLAIFSKEVKGMVVWQGTIDLVEYDPFTQNTKGLWIHTDQKDVPREEWTKFFLDENPAELIVNQK